MVETSKDTHNSPRRDPGLFSANALRRARLGPASLYTGCLSWPTLTEPGMPPPAVGTALQGPTLS